MVNISVWVFFGYSWVFLIVTGILKSQQTNLIKHRVCGVINNSKMGFVCSPQCFIRLKWTITLSRMQCIFWPNLFRPSDSVISFVWLYHLRIVQTLITLKIKSKNTWLVSGDNDARYLRKIFRHVEVHLELVLVVGDLRLGGHLRVCHAEAVTGSRSVLCSVFTAEITARDCPLSSPQWATLTF